VIGVPVPLHNRGCCENFRTFSFQKLRSSTMHLS
jgi:hypothetical protein